jgi:hypothetical protein
VHFKDVRISGGIYFAPIRFPIRVPIRVPIAPPRTIVAIRIRSAWLFCVCHREQVEVVQVDRSIGEL